MSNPVHPRHIKWLAEQTVGPRLGTPPGSGASSHAARMFFRGRLIAELERFGELFVRYNQLPPSLEQMRACRSYVVDTLRKKGLVTSDKLIVTDETFASIMEGLGIPVANEARPVTLEKSRIGLI